MYESWESLIVVICILSWLIYSIVVIIYLNILTRKYLIPISRDSYACGKELKTYSQLVNQYADADAINILVLSGGGVRGMVPLHILAYIEEQTGKKVGELFDFISGSSTGAISAAGFVIGDVNGGYKFSAKNILDNYWSNSKKIFSSPWYHQWLTAFGLFAPRFIPDNKIAVLDGYYDDLTLSELKGNLLIPIYNIDQNKLEIIKNWCSRTGTVNPNFLVTDLINGASSPPTLFPPVAFSLNKQNYMFIDPAILLNNPVLQVLLHLRTLFPTHKLNMVLIGNGSSSGGEYNYRGLFSFGLYGLYQYLFSAPALSSKLYIDFIEEYLVDTERYDKNINFLRINSVPRDDLDPVSLSKRNIKKIRRFANKMLNENMPTIEKIITLLSNKKVKKD
jgi:hypothetical protein